MKMAKIWGSKWYSGDYVLHKVNPRPIPQSRLAEVGKKFKEHGINFIVDAVVPHKKYNIYIQSFRRGEFK